MYDGRMRLGVAFVLAMFTCIEAWAVSSPPTPIVTFLGERYGVFYQWSTVDANLIDPWNETNLQINSELIHKGQIRTQSTTIFSSIEQATAYLNAKTHLFDHSITQKPIYLNEVLISESELDHYTKQYPGARFKGQGAYSPNDFQIARNLRTSHQFSGIGLTAEELATLEHRTLQQLNPQNPTWGSLSQVIKKYLHQRISLITQVRSSTMFPYARAQDATVLRLSSVGNHPSSKYMQSYALAWAPREGNAQEVAPPIRSQKLIGMLVLSSTAFNIAGLGLALASPTLNVYAQEKGLNCEEAKTNLHTLKCKWEDRWSINNNHVLCTVEREVFRLDHDACGSTFDSIKFNLPGYYKDKFKSSGLLTQGRKVPDQTIQEIAQDLQQEFNIHEVTTQENQSTGNLIRG